MILDLNSSSLSLLGITILNLIFTSQPDLINDIDVVPGISDHEAVIFAIKFSSSAPPTKQLRKVYQYHKAHINRILEEMNHFSSTFLLSILSQGRISKV